MKFTKQFLLPSLVLTLPIVGAVTNDENLKNVSVHVNSEVTLDGSGGVLPDMFEATSQALSLDPFYILESIQNTYVPSALHMTDIIRNFVASKPTSSEFWEEAKKSQEKLQEHVHRQLEAAATYFKSSNFTDVMTAMNHIVNATATFREDIKGALDARGITLDALTKELEGVFMTIVHNLESIPPPDKAPGHAERAEMVDKILDDVTQGLMKLATRYEIDKEVAAYLLVLKPQVQALTVVIGDINEQHPQLLPNLVLSVVVLLIPELWILRPLLGLFGFGPVGLVKGLATAWVQRFFWGAAVEAGGWFSWLGIGIGMLPNWAELVVKTPFLIGGALTTLLPSLNATVDKLVAVLSWTSDE